MDLGGIGDDARVRILAAVKDRLGFNGACEALGISKAALSRYLRGERRVPDRVLGACVGILGEEEVKRLLSAQDRLRALGIVRENGSIDYSTALEVVALAVRDEYLKREILSFVVHEFREDLRRMLGISLSGVRLRWSDDFEAFLSGRKRRKRVMTAKMLKYYKALFEKYLEGKELGEELVEFVAKHENGWLRNVFRHYVQYLYYRRTISPEAFGWIMEVVPSRSYRVDVRPYQVDLEDVRRTLEFLRENHKAYYAAYRLMLESGARVAHALEVLRSWRPDEVVEIPGADIVTRRLVAFPDKGFARYYAGLGGGTTKRCDWIYMSAETLELVREIAPLRAGANKEVISTYARRHGLVRPKYMRKLAWRLMIRAMEREVARFIQSRFGEIRVSEARYEDLLSEADGAYPSYLKILAGERLLPSPGAGS